MSFPAKALLENWDVQQSAYIAHREARFDAVLDILGLTFGEAFHVVDLGCGPGSFSLRVLKRFPKARVTSIDLDPLLLCLAKEALNEYQDRVRFIRADMALPDVFHTLGEKPDAVISSTAIHWLLPEQQTALYRTIAGVLAEGGIFMNADHQRFDALNPIQKALAEKHDNLTQENAWRQGAQDWDTWFAQAVSHSALFELQAEREKVFANRPLPLATHVDFQLAILRQAGFAESGTVWQFLDDYVIAGWK